MSEKTDYDRAIEAYRFQVERYHTWMNYYSLFHGALLAADLEDSPRGVDGIAHFSSLFDGE